MSETDISNEKPFGADAIKPEESRKVASLEDILNSHVDIKRSPPLENGMVIEGKVMPAMKLTEVATRFPVQIDDLTKEEIKTIIGAENKRGDKSDEEWFKSLSDNEIAAINKSAKKDVDKFKRAALQLSIIAVNPPLTEELAMAVIEDFSDVRSLNKFMEWISDMTIIKEVEIKNY